VTALEGGLIAPLLEVPGSTFSAILPTLGFEGPASISEFVDVEV